MSTPEELMAAAETGKPYVNENAVPTPQIYEPEEIVCVLTFDQKQAWALMVLLGPYKEVEEESWDIYRAVWDVRRRLADALGVE